MLIALFESNSETDTALVASLRTLGHEPLRVPSNDLREASIRLLAHPPDRVFDPTPEGTGARLAEALGLSVAGTSGAARFLLQDPGVLRMKADLLELLVPMWVAVDALEGFDPRGLRFPVAVSSEPRVVESTLEGLLATVTGRLAGARSVVVEEHIEGDPVAVPVLGPTAKDLPVVRRDRVEAPDPHDLPGPIAIARHFLTALGVTGPATVNLVRDTAGAYWLNGVDAGLDLRAPSAISRALAAEGLGVTELVASILGPGAVKAKRARKLRVGFTFNLRRLSNTETDREAEFDSPETIASIHAAIEAHGHEVIDLEATRDLPVRLPSARIDLAFNISEGVFGRSREAQVPALLEMLDIPHTGSDALTLSLALDKALAKKVIAQAGLRTAPFVLMTTGKEELPDGFVFPAIVKPVAEGSSRGIVGKCVAEDEAELRVLVARAYAQYSQPILVEGFLPGREFTIGLLGESKPRVLPILEVIFTKPDEERFPIYSFESKFHGKDNVRFEVPAKLEPALGTELERAAKGCFAAMGCRDFARIDFRLDAAGRPSFIECNPLPGLSPGFSDYCVIAQAAGLDHTALIGEIMAPVLRRVRKRRGRQS